MQLPAKLQEFLFEQGQIHHQLARQPKHREVIGGDVLSLRWSGHFRYKSRIPVVSLCNHYAYSKIRNIVPILWPARRCAVSLAKSEKAGEFRQPGATEEPG